MKNGYMSLWDHLNELRKRLILSSVCVIVLSTICYVYWAFLLSLLIKPAGGRELVYLNASFIGLFLLAFGLAFETPLVVVFLTHFGVVRPVALIKQWRVAIVLILLFAAIITPDWSPVTMGLMAAPIMGLYILGIALSFIFAPRKKKIKERAAATS